MNDKEKKEEFKFYCVAIDENGNENKIYARVLNNNAVSVWQYTLYINPLKDVYVSLSYLLKNHNLKITQKEQKRLCIKI